MNNIHRRWEYKMYYYPIPQSEILNNHNMYQNPDW
ncbi:MAG: RagB/SusD family nutrient uptake outer membrane protein [Methanococcaceae archaeon]